MSKRSMVTRIAVNDKIKDFKPNVACIGYFDALHLGHQELIRQTITKARKLDCRSMLICFEPDPMQLISNIPQKHILTYKERLSKIKELGIDDIVVFKFDNDFMKIGPEVFINDYLNKMNIKELVCGFDFTFGYKGTGNIELLKRFAKFNIDVIPEIKYYGKKISSTRIKEEIIKGNLKLVNRLLNYQYYLVLKVIKSSKNGSKWLIQAKLKDNSRLVPLNIDKLIKNISYKDNLFYIDSDVSLKKDEELLIVFENE